MYGSGRLLNHQGIISLITPLDQAEILLKRLRPFLLLSRVKATLTSIVASLIRSPRLAPGDVEWTNESTTAGEFGETQWVIGDASHTHDPEADIQRLMLDSGSSDNNLADSAFHNKRTTKCSVE